MPHAATAGSGGGASRRTPQRRAAALEGGGERRPVRGADHLRVLLAEVAVPRVHERGGDHPLLERAHEGDWAVVDEDVDPELDAAGHLVVGAAQVVIAET